MAKKNRKKRQSGFTLIEIMIVLAIVGLLFSIVGVNVINRFKAAKSDTAKIQINSYREMLDHYYLAHGMYPHTSQGLEALVKKPSAGKIPENYPDGGYSKKQIQKDPWNSPYRYVCDDYQNYSLTSDGPDQTEGTEDDVKVE